MSSPTSTNKGDLKRIIKCFCGCTDMTVEEVRRIYRLANSVRETLLDSEASRLLRQFMTLHRSGDRSEAEQYLDIYEKCSEFLKEDQHTFAQNNIEELCDLGLPYDLEQDMTRRMLNGQQTDIKLGLNRIQGKCCKEIEVSQNFDDFKKAILKKLAH
ncbi:uncharacterized protein LOC115620656 [Scaptodrosophila lebanonensis]|uniref:Uncharacterized protein LOC115620656 n=1 Tax=Drosophila lebanonensis TaxID=7225 RepID=A0A6J2SZ57_DROLE|nr:uncharacterized protein LOC115620656 [Scaptodrosophila lebanonensis]